MAFSSTPVSGGRCRASPPISPVGLLPSTSLSPTRLSRLQEKEELRHLNDRLAAYIERVRVLEAEKSALHHSLTEQEEKSDRQLDTLRLCYEKELADARRTLDDVAIQRATLQVELGKISEEHRQLRSRSSKIEADLNLAQAHVKDLSAQLSEKEADLAAALVEKRSLMNDLHELKDEAVSLKQSLEDSKEQLNNEMLRGVDLENHKKTLLEQMTLKKRLHEDELKETKRVYENRIAEIESIYQSKVSDALQGLRKQQEEQIQGYKLELERTFHAKMANAQLSSAKHSDFAKAAQEELKEAKLRVETLSSQLNQYQSQNIAFETRIRELQEMMDYDRDLHRRRMAEKEQEMAQAQQQTQAQLEEYENLLDVKLALDLEIDTYRTMLEGEEQRLRLSPSSSSRSTATQVTSQGQQFLPGKKRKMKEAKKRGHSVGFKTVQHASSSGKVSIEEIDADGKFVRLKNKSDEDQPLHGWVLRRHLGSMSDATYTFPSQFTLQAGQVVTIWGAAAGVSPGPSDLVWKSQRSWGAADTIDVTLIRDDGEELAERRIMHVPTGEESSEQDDDYEEITESEMEFLSQTKRRRKKKCCLVS
ncbi:lamin-L(III)-like [Indicator indicator]|uniref:lamin-L(III)-like n=1 Tax=Indicator indicator TaxID=1002788 RepID=UPI0023DF3C9C|nr:lamin-L(III)-like [Indicator indicator]